MNQYISIMQHWYSTFTSTRTGPENQYCKTYNYNISYIKESKQFEPIYQHATLV